MNEEFISAIQNEVKEAVKAGMDEFVQTEVERIKQSLSIPVGREGKRIIRSLPGENPRKDKGDLQGSIQSEVTEEGVLIVGEIFTDDPKAAWLNNGTQDERIAPRPFWDRAKQRVAEGADKLEATIAEKIESNNTPSYSAP